MKKIKLLAFVSFIVASVSSLQGREIAIVGEKNDAGVTEFNTIDDKGWLHKGFFRAGLAGGSSAGTYGRNGIWVFRLPEDLKVEDITKISFEATLLGINDFYPNMHFGVDIYALSVRDEPEVLPSDYYAGETPDDRANVTLIEKDFYRGGEKIVYNKRITISEAGAEKLLQFFVEQLRNGAAGKYIFFRVSPNFKTSYESGRGYDFATADNSKESNKPLLTISVR